MSKRKDLGEITLTVSEDWPGYGRDPVTTRRFCQTNEDGSELCIHYDDIPVGDDAYMTFRESQMGSLPVTVRFGDQSITGVAYGVDPGIRSNSIDEDMHYVRIRPEEKV